MGLLPKIFLARVLFITSKGKVTYKCPNSVWADLKALDLVFFFLLFVFKYSKSIANFSILFQLIHHQE